jgi:ribonuclease P protein component
VIVSNKVSKKAILRNRIKRQIREIVRLSLKKIKPGFDCVLIAKKPITEATHQEVEQTIVNIFKKLNLY